MNHLGIDVGGTFTDVVVVDDESGDVRCLKVATDYAQPAAGIIRAFDAAELNSAAIDRVRLGTTLGLNALLTRRGARTGLITTGGFRDVLEIRRTHRDRLFDLAEAIPAPLIPRDLRFEVVERVDADGREVTPLDEDGVRAAWRALRASGVTSVAIVFLFSFKNPTHEQRAREIVREEGGADTVFCSSDVLPVHREYERTSTTAAAAFVAPVVRDYIVELQSRLRQRGVAEQALSVLTNSGGSMSAAAAAGTPVPTLLSGPAGGVTAAGWLSREAGIIDVLTLDMGGTSCDVSGIEGGIPDERLDFTVAGLDITYPTLDIHTIGAGGGSIAWLDRGGALRVGPQSAGSEPGPACYGRGGELPTVTDANLILGRYDDSASLGGSLTLDAHLAREAIRTHIAEPSGLTVEQAAAGIIRLVNAGMVNAVRTISVERGRDPRKFALVAYGGGGPVHAVDVARELEMTTIVIPPFPGCTSAYGGTLAAFRRDALRSITTGVDVIDPAVLDSVANELLETVVGELAAEGSPRDEITVEMWMNLRYRGQAHDLSIRHDGIHVDATSIAIVAKGFEELHLRQYGHSFSDVPVELTTIRLTARHGVTEPRARWRWDRILESSGNERSVYFESTDSMLPSRVLDRSDLVVGQRIDGPAIIHQTDATILVAPEWRAVNHESGSLIMTRKVS